MSSRLPCTGVHSATQVSKKGRRWGMRVLAPGKAWVPEFESSAPTYKAGVVTRAPATPEFLGTETGGSLGLASHQTSSRFSERPYLKT